jgi:hypothetical protein
MFENEGVGADESASTQESEDLTSSEGASTEQTSMEQKLVELDSLERFKYAGRELTPKELQSMIMMQSDYTRKTQALAEERKYYDNLSADLAAVKANPSLAEKFKSVYPEKFHGYLDYAISQQGQGQTQQTQQQQQQQAQIDPEFKRRFDALEADLNERKQAAINAELDAKFKTLSEKYPYADEEAAIARATALLDRGEKITDKVWDGIWKSVHERNEGLFKQKYAAQFNKQKEANLKGKDGASGGGIPGQAPKQPKNIKEASRFALEELQQS